MKREIRSSQSVSHLAMPSVMSVNHGVRSLFAQYIDGRMALFSAVDARAVLVTDAIASLF